MDDARRARWSAAWDRGTDDDRLAALEQRVGALVGELHSWTAHNAGHGEQRTWGDLASRLAALRAPGVGATETIPAHIHSEMLQLRHERDTARRERDEAVGALLNVRAHGAVSDSCWCTAWGKASSPEAPHGDNCLRARALVAGQGVAASATATIVEALVKDQNEELAARDVEIAKARGLIERAERWITAWVRMTKWPETHEALLADLRAYLGDGT